MKNWQKYKEPLSMALRRHPHGNKDEVINTIRWVGFSAFGIFLTMSIVFLLSNSYVNAFTVAVGIIPIIVSLFLIKKESVTVPTTILSITIILLITWLATHGQGINDIGVLGFPVILIVAGLILRGRVLINLVLLVIACMAWLVFGDVLNLYEPVYLAGTNMEDFFIGSVIVLVAGNAIYRLVRNVYESLSRAEQEIKRRETAEQEREAIIQQLKRKNQELDRFAVRVSHDLKTPLITLAGFLGFLEKDIHAGNFEKARRDFSQINDAAKKMGKFVDELLDLSRVGRIINPPADVPFDEIIEDALKVTEGLLKAKQVQVEIDSKFPVIHVDRARLVQVMQNLITNAVKFMGAQPVPKIKIESKETADGLVIAVSDNGIGIAPENHERIFELFNKLNPEIEGTGLGLGLVKKIVEVHGGRIWVESEIGRGATFMFTLGNTHQAIG